MGGTGKSRPLRAHRRRRAVPQKGSFAESEAVTSLSPFRKRGPAPGKPAFLSGSLPALDMLYATHRIWKHMCPSPQLLGQICLSPWSFQKSGMTCYVWASPTSSAPTQHLHPVGMRPVGWAKWWAGGPAQQSTDPAQGTGGQRGSSCLASLTPGSLGRRNAPGT